MSELTLSFMVHTPQTDELLHAVLDEFEALSGIRVQLSLYQWTEAHAEFNKVARYHHGPDVSEIGSTWVSDLIAQHALRPFSAMELAQIGKQEDFLSQSWKNGQLGIEKVQWALPLLSETYVIHYRQDVLEAAGIDPAQAFASHEALARTVRALHGAPGLAAPVELPLQLDQFGTLHTLASWVWAAGGDFCTADGRKVLFNSPQALSAIRDYFALLHGLPASARQALRERQVSLFQQGKSAIYFGTLTFLQNFAAAPKPVQENWRVAVLPGARFLGGSGLVVWKHTRNERAALELARYLTSSPVQSRWVLALSALPPRLSALSAPHIQDDPRLRVFAESLRSGRSYPIVPLWGLIEDRLVGALLQIGDAVLSPQPGDLDTIVRQHIEPLARRLNLTLAQ